MNKIGRFGEFGGQYVPETVMAAVQELQAAYDLSLIHIFVRVHKGGMNAQFREGGVEQSEGPSVQGGGGDDLIPCRS